MYYNICQVILMYRKKKIDSKYLLIIILAIILVFIGIMSIILKGNRKLTYVEKVLKDTSLVVTKTLKIPFDYVGEQINYYKDNKNLYKKYLKLKKENEKINTLESSYDESKKEIEELKKLLEIDKTLSEKSYLNATVINRKINYWNDSLEIDKGSNSGIKKGMAVMTGKGLIGYIISTSNFNSTVKLLTNNDVNNKISVKIQTKDNYLYGLLSGYKDGHFIIEGISENTEIDINSNVTTTGLGNDFPSGIYIGKVESISKDNFDLYRTINVKSDVNFDSINYVTVLKREAS